MIFILCPGESSEIHPAVNRCHFFPRDFTGVREDFFLIFCYGENSMAFSQIVRIQELGELGVEVALEEIGGGVRKFQRIPGSNVAVMVVN